MDAAFTFTLTPEEQDVLVGYGDAVAEGRMTSNDAVAIILRARIVRALDIAEPADRHALKQVLASQGLPK